MTGGSSKFRVEVVEDAPARRRAPPVMNDADVAKELYQHAHDKKHHDGHDAHDDEDGLKVVVTYSEPEGDTLTEQIVSALRDIHDPEIPVNIYDLGLIYDLKEEDGQVSIVMTLTTPNCPVAESMPGEVENRLMAVPGVATVDVKLVWDPAWDPNSMTDEAKLELGML